MRTLLLFISLVLAVPGFSQEKSLTLATLNCYWFFNGDEDKASADKPTSTLEYSTKAGHLIGLLSKDAPLFVGFQDIGGGENLAALAHSSTARYGRTYQMGMDMRAIEGFAVIPGYFSMAGAAP
jgi:hypothetical protein